MEPGSVGARRVMHSWRPLRMEEIVSVREERSQASSRDWGRLVGCEGRRGGGEYGG